MSGVTAAAAGVTHEYNFYTVIFSTTFLTPRKEDEIRSINHYRNYSDLEEKLKIIRSTLAYSFLSAVLR